MLKKEIFLFLLNIVVLDPKEIQSCFSNRYNVFFIFLNFLKKMVYLIFIKLFDVFWVNSRYKKDKIFMVFRNFERLFKIVWVSANCYNRIEFFFPFKN